MTTEEGNFLLADFVGLKPTDLKDSFCEVVYRLPECIGEFMLCSHWGHLLFFNDWRWLMAVVEKIEGLKPKNNSSNQFSVIIKGKSCIIIDHFKDGTDFQKDFLNLHYNFHETKRATVWQACVIFVKWYNLNKNIYE